MALEAPGSFYLGKEYDLAARALRERTIHYDARDLTTHAVCVGMTGSGKTGLCLSLLEEAALDRVPALIIDPKGDMTNLLLTFPELRPSDFRPWINVDDARRQGLDEDTFAARQAELWRRGLADWGQDGERIRRLRESSDFCVYTPGSEAGVSVSVLHSFDAPELDWATDAELLRERIQGTVSALLGLVGIDADPVRSREHILLSNLFEHHWRQGQSLDMARLILAVQTPPIRQLGVFDVDTFYPQRDRFGLAMALNNIIAAPAFQSWLQGQPLDIPGFLTAPDGRPRHSVFYIAHLSDAERMFFVTILLNQVITWMRTQPGTTSLRAILYMDEIAGYFPPVANPPSKRPMLTLLKQARAYGLGVMLATQNPVDLDYKGLSNTGTWFIGRLQTERDKARLLDGLQSVSTDAGGSLDRAEINRTLSALDKRVFLMHNVHGGRPTILHTRWAMSYLRGPLTRSQVRALVAGRTPDQMVRAPAALERPVAAPAPAAAAPVPATHAMVTPAGPPVLPNGVEVRYLPVRHAAPARSGATLAYQAAVLGMGSVFFVDQRRGVDEHEEFALLLAPPERPGPQVWAEAEALDLDPRDLQAEPEPGARFGPVPEAMNESREFTAFRRDLAEHLYRSRNVTLLHCPAVKLYSHPGESESAFRLRVQQAGRGERDAELDRANGRFDKRLAVLNDRLRRAEATLATRKANAQARQRETVVSFGESVLGMFLGRRTTRAASSAMSKQRQTTMARMEADKAGDTVESVRAEIEQLQREQQQELAAIRERWEQELARFEELPVRPRRTDVQVSLLSLAWVPYWEVSAGGRIERVAAY